MTCFWRPLKVSNVLAFSQSQDATEARSRLNSAETLYEVARILDQPDPTPTPNDVIENAEGQSNLTLTLTSAGELISFLRPTDADILLHIGQDTSRAALHCTTLCQNIEAFDDLPNIIQYLATDQMS
ncbi:hypothetical protein LTR66_017433 [Elasticomyces elasticus]|nr:hypothetical protein LTR66_017433 [Elasticomyces elasticus]